MMMIPSVVTMTVNGKTEQQMMMRGGGVGDDDDGNDDVGDDDDVGGDDDVSDDDVADDDVDSVGQLASSGPISQWGLGAHQTPLVHGPPSI